MHRAALFVLFLSSFSVAHAQLTADQRAADFHSLADLFAKRYALLDWKKKVQKFDALDLVPWLDRVAKTKDDLDFYEICVEYVASLNDAHDSYSLPSNFVASLGFTVDIYDGKVLIDSVNRDRLPIDKYPFIAGDELISVEGKSPKDLIAAYGKYSISANQRSTDRFAASRIPRRTQFFMPHAHEIAESATVEIRSETGIASYILPWLKTGNPVTVLAPAPPLKTKAMEQDETGFQSRWIQKHQNMRVTNFPFVLGEGAVRPVFNLPENFVQRVGLSRDSFLSGTFESGGFKIGYLRVPDFYTFSASSRFRDEITFLQENTDGLILDIMRNPGGSACAAETTASYVMPGKFKLLTHELQVTWLDVLELSSELASAKRFDASPETISQLESLLAAAEAAYRKNNGRTAPQPICGTNTEREAATDRTGKMISYTKPLIVLVDEFTASSGELFAAMIQDNGRGKVIGTRTMGAGGAVDDFSVGVYSEGDTSVTLSQINRLKPVLTTDYPLAPYIENIGVRPDIPLDYMSRDNLLNNGKAFMDALASAVIDEIKAAAQ